MSRKRRYLWMFVGFASGLALSFALASAVLAAEGTSREQICWTNPSENVDGSALEDLVKVRLHWGTESGDYAGNTDVPTTAPGDNVCAFLELSPGQYFIAATAFDEEGNESAFSNEITRGFTAPPGAVVMPLEPGCVGCDKRQAMVVVFLTGETLTLRWEPVEADQIEVEIHEYPPKAGSVALARGTFNDSTTSWEWTPTRAEMYYSRMRVCDDGSCSAWANSFDLGYLYYARLSPATGGGIN